MGGRSDTTAVPFTIRISPTVKLGSVVTFCVFPVRLAALLPMVWRSSKCPGHCGPG